MSYIVQKGDNLAIIARKIYGDMSKWREIANFTGITNPRLIYPGDVVYYQLTEQTMAFASSYEAAFRSEVVVQQGDTLSTIARRVLGNSADWKLIWRQNDGIDNPDTLTAGTVIYYIDASAQTASLDFNKTTLTNNELNSDSQNKTTTSNSLEISQQSETTNTVESLTNLDDQSVSNLTNDVFSVNNIVRAI